MAEADIRVRINRLSRIEFTQGEDRALTFSFWDETAGFPLDLTGAQLTLALPRDGGGTIKRRTGPLPFNWATAQTLNGLTTIALASHGLVTGDLVTLAAGSTDPLPAPFQANTPYLVSTDSNDTFGLLDISGNKVALTTPLVATALLTVGDFAISNPVIGQAILALNETVSQSCAIGQGLSYQLTFRNPAGVTRILAGTNQLDVFAQPLP